MDRFDVCIGGAGVVGRSLALALARQGLAVALIDGPKAQAEDIRAYALNPASVALLAQLKVWNALPPDARTPVYDMQVEGDSGGAAIGFSAWQQKVRELATIVDTAALEAALDNALSFAPHVTRVGEAVPATLRVLAEGRDSVGRSQLGVVFDTVDYAQRAIAARLVSSKPHLGQAHQWFRSPDVLALLPFDRPSPGNSYALVWSLPTDRAMALLAADAPAFEQALNEATNGGAGELKLASPRAAWPLGWGRAEAVHGPGWVLVGDAAHLVHPLAGQGLNLGLADVAVLSRLLAAREPWRKVDDARLLRRYARERAVPVVAMGQVTDGLLRLFADPSPLLRELRNRGLSLVNRATPFKRWLVGQALDT